MAKRGRPSLLSDEAIKDIMKELYTVGKTDQEVANILRIDESQITRWKQKDPDFYMSIKDWKVEADKVVEQSLYKSAKGFNRTVEKIDKDGCIHEITEEQPPNPTSMIFWLKNRQPKQWRDKQEVEHSGDINVAVNIIKK